LPFRVTGQAIVSDFKHSTFKYSTDWTLVGVDFTSAPSRRKPITVARGVLDSPLSAGPGGAIRVLEVERCPDWAAFDGQLNRLGPWVGAFDLPFGLPRTLVQTLGWPENWREMIDLYTQLSRDEIRARFRSFCADRPVGHRFAHRATDGPARSSPSMKWVNPPVAFMLHAGVPRLLAAGVTLPGLQAGDPDRIALEAYPALVARACVGKQSYKSDAAQGATGPRRAAREAILESLERGAYGFDGRPVILPLGMREQLVDEPGADRLDAVLALVLAAWALTRRATNWGLPSDMDPLEGWIVGA
jgi:hypothetical protein